jgi:hypothetical protein
MRPPTILKRKLPEIDLLLYMGEKQKEQIEQLQKDDLMGAGIKVVAVDKDRGSPLISLKGSNSLETGEWYPCRVMCSGEKISEASTLLFWDTKLPFPKRPTSWHFFQTSPCTSFLPGAPARGRYHVSISEPIEIKSPSRSERRKPLRKQHRNMPIIWRKIFDNTLSNGTTLSHSLGKKSIDSKDSFRIDIFSRSNSISLFEIRTSEQ